MKNTRTRFAISHAVLILLSVLFSLPFLWMLSTSIKADDEIIHDPMVWIPELPNRVTDSPYLDTESHPPYWRRPTAFPADQDWVEFASTLRSSIRNKALRTFEGPEWPMTKDPIEPALFARAEQDIEDFIWNLVRNRLPDGDWAKGNAIQLFIERIQTEDVVKAWQRAYRAVSIAEIRLRNSAADDIGVSPRMENKRIPYSIRDWEKPIQIARIDIPLASPEEKTDQIMVRLRGDASYHRISMQFELNGKTYETAEPAFLSLGELQDFFWKFTPQLKYEIDHLTLVERQQTKESDLAPNTARVTLSLVPTPYWHVLWQRLMKNYLEVFRWVPYSTYTWVTIKITTLNILGQLLACSLVAFAFARLVFPGRDTLFVLMLATMMLPPEVTMIPQFVLFSWLGTYNTLFPLTIMSYTGAPFFIFLMRQFYMSIPQDLSEAAKIDGCGYFTIYWRIMLPLVKPALAAIAIFQFQNSWNEFLQPLIYITDDDKTPISVGLFMFRQAQGGQWAELMAASSMMTLPIIFLFFFTQRYFIQGVTLTGLKG
jgi:multiple sugar transport system permease protein